MYENGAQKGVAAPDYGKAEAHGFAVLIFILSDLDGGVSAGGDVARCRVLARRRLLRPSPGRGHRFLCRLGRGFVLAAAASARYITS